MSVHPCKHHLELLWSLVESRTQTGDIHPSDFTASLVDTS